MGAGATAAMLARIDRDALGEPRLEAPILIRTAYLERQDHRVAGSAGRRSGVRRGRCRPLPEVRSVLAERNADLARFWLEPQGGAAVSASSAAQGRRALVVDAEDEWTAMLAHLLRHLGMVARVLRWDAASEDDLAGRLGLSLAPLPSPHQGTQRQVEVFGRRVRVGFDNTFSAWVPPRSVADDERFGLPGQDVGAAGRRVSGWAVPQGR